MKYKCKICGNVFKAENLNVTCPRCNKNGVVPYDEHFYMLLISLGLIVIWLSIGTPIFTLFHLGIYWILAGTIIVGSLALMELILWIVNKIKSPKYFIDKSTKEVHYYK